MLSKIKSLLIGLACALSLVGIARFCHHQTRGFALSKIQSNLPLSEGWDSVGAQETHALLEQKFYFLGRGLQSFVFASEDGKYVLKLFNNRYQRKIQLFSCLSYCPWMGRWSQENVAYFTRKLEQTFTSYKIAWDLMQEQTGLVYMHLSPTSHLPSSLTLVDRLNIHHTIDPNQTGFLLQKRVTQVYPALQALLAKQDLESLQKTISNLVKLFFWKWRQGIDDNDPLIRTNYGVSGTQVFQIDVGPLSKQTTYCTLEEQREKILKITASLRLWLTGNAPQLIPILDQELEQQLSLRDDP